MSEATNPVVAELEKVARSIATQLQQPGGYDKLSDMIISSEVLASYATYKVQEATFSKLSEQIALQIESLKAQSTAISDLKKQSRATTILAGATIVLAGATVVLAILAYLK